MRYMEGMVSVDQRGEIENPFWEHMGFTLESLEHEVGRARMSFDVGPQHLQWQKILHGGVLSSLVDSCGAMAFFALTGEAVRTIHLAIQYLAPVHEGHVQASGRVVRAGGRVVVTSVEVTNAEGDLVAEGHILYSRARPHATI